MNQNEVLDLQPSNIGILDINIAEDDYINSEIFDERITEKIHNTVTIIKKKNIPKDIAIDFKKLLNIKDKDSDQQFEHIKPMNIERRKVNGSKFFNFLKDFKVILSYMSEEELKHLLSLRILYQNYDSLLKTEINSIEDGAIHTFIPFVNKFMEVVNPIAYTPKCKTVDDKSLQELYFSEDHLKFLVKLIILSKITLIFTDCVKKEFRADAKKQLANKLWNAIFVEEDRNINMKNKIHKLITSRFISTAHNEKRFWDVAAFANINIQSQANLIYNELKTDSILMLSYDRNPLSFLDVYLKCTILYISKRQFPLEYVLNNYDGQFQVMNSELSTEFKFNEFQYVLMEKTLNDFIDKKVKPLIINDSIVDEFKSHFQKNILHFWIVIPMIARMQNISQMYLTSIEKERFILLTIYVYYKLINLKCFTMAELIKSNINEIETGIYNEDVKNMSVLLAKYLRSEELKNFLEDKQLNNNLVNLSKCIIQPLITMTMNQYTKFGKTERVETLPNVIIHEYVKFMNFFINL